MTNLMSVVTVYEHILSPCNIMARKEKIIDRKRKQFHHSRQTRRKQKEKMVFVFSPLVSSYEEERFVSLSVQLQRSSYQEIKEDEREEEINQKEGKNR